MSRLQLGDYPGGFPEYEWRKRLPQPYGARPINARPWFGESDVGHGSIYVHREQGLGDALQFCRFALQVRELGARVTIGAPSALVELITSLHEDIIVVDEARPPIGFDYHAPMMSLPLALGTRLETVPSRPSYLRAARPKWRRGGRAWAEAQNLVSVSAGPRIRPTEPWPSGRVI